MTIPGVKQRTAEVLIAEIGVDMSAFPTAKHLASWAGVCPGNHESAGRQRRGTTRRGNVHLKTALVTAASAAKLATSTCSDPSSFAVRLRIRERGSSAR